jgi:hypothetical protein
MDLKTETYDMDGKISKSYVVKKKGSKNRLHM